jgi:hypothetical protein
MSATSVGSQHRMERRPATAVSSEQTASDRCRLEGSRGLRCPDGHRPPRGLRAARRSAGRASARGRPRPVHGGHGCPSGRTCAGWRRCCPLRRRQGSDRLALRVPAPSRQRRDRGDRGRLRLERGASATPIRALARRGRDEAERERLRRISRTPQEALVGVFDELERRYGGATEFLRGARLGEAGLCPGLRLIPSRKAGSVVSVIPSS